MLNLKANIAHKILAAFLALSLLPISFMGYFFYKTTEAKIVEEVFDNLESIADSKTRMFNSYILEKERDVKALAINPSVIKAMEEYNVVFHGPGVDSESYRELDEKYRSYLTYFAESFGYHDLFLICDESYLVFTVQREEDFGTSLYDDLHKDTELSKIYEKLVRDKSAVISDLRHYAPSDEAATFIGAPVIKDNAVIGAIIFQLNNNELYNEVQNYIGLGETGEIVVASREDNEALFIAPLRHDPHAALKRRVLIGSEEALPIQYAIRKESGAGMSIDYRNREILAVWRYLPQLRWGVVVKIDSDEAFKHIHDLRYFLIVIGSLTILVVVIVSLGISRKISRPIEALREGSVIIGNGDLDHRVGTGTKDEVGELSRAFDEMTLKLKASRTELENEVTERKKAEEDVMESLRGKEILLKEIHHRVKNNMAVIVSLLNLQSNKIEDRRYKEMFLNSMRRIKSMALIHEKLYKTKDFDRVDFQEYVDDLIESMFVSYNLDARNIGLKTDVEGMSLDIDKAVPCGLIINELLANALEHAFSEGMEGEVHVAMTRSNEGTVLLVVGDNGIGMPEDMDIENPTSLGMTLVNALVTQLQGEIEVVRDKGSSFKIAFPG